MKDLFFTKPLPHSLESERSVLSSMLINKEAIETAYDILTSEDFYDPDHRKIFEAMIELYNDKAVVDIVTLQNKLKQKGIPAGIDSLKRLLTSEATSVHVKSYAEIVKNKAMLRNIIETSMKITSDCYLEEKDPEELFAGAEKAMFDACQITTKRDIVPTRKIAIDTLKQIEAASHMEGSISGISTGYGGLDYMTAGFQKSNLILIAARPSMGKTALGLNIASNMVFRGGKTVAFFSLEMSSNELMQRLMSMGAKIDGRKLKTGKLTDDEWVKLVEATSTIGKSNIFIDPTSGISPAEILSKARRIKAEHGLDAIFVDYLQIMRLKMKAESRQQEVAKISGDLKGVAKELDVPVIALSQLSRETTKGRGDKRPELSHLRDSGAIEQDADIVMFIHRKDYYEEVEPEEQNIAEIIFAKNRNGPVGTVKLYWKPEYTKFYNLSK